MRDFRQNKNPFVLLALQKAEINKNGEFSEKFVPHNDEVVVLKISVSE